MKWEEYVQPDNSIDVICPERVSDYELFFGPITPSTKPFITSATNIGQILYELDLIESKSWARKNKWWYELEYGFNHLKFGFRKINLYILVHPERTEDEQIKSS